MQKDEFVEAVRASEDNLYRVGMAILKNEENCADAAQEALMIAYQKLDTLREKKYFKTWLTRIMINECYKILKRNQNMVSYEEYIEKNEKGAEDQNYTELYQAVGQLPADVRVAVVLFYIEGFSVKEIAVILEVNENTVKSRLYRGRTQLKKILGDKEEVLC
ncbi:MAG: sigma-70 family RNA polymerase sigma factor [Clostridia bacterium]|nr:sigma-70 family RNA polymerase sigma factor [Clostridia bacterium]NCC43597.1 sigma-70 family RNA polymerase sigma factor [Clostridia bacterium]